MTEIENEKDPNDTRQISFMVGKDESQRIDKCIAILKDYDPGFYVRIIGVGDNYFYKISTHQSNMEHETYKKFIFQVELMLGNKLTIR